MAIEKAVSAVKQPGQYPTAGADLPSGSVHGFLIRISHSSMQTLLTPENYARGFLIDEELIGGITIHPDQPGLFVAYVLRHTTGEYLGYQPFESLEQALAVLNQVQRPWRFEQAGGCGDGKCGKTSCDGGGCGIARSAPQAPVTV